MEKKGHAHVLYFSSKGNLLHMSSSHESPTAFLQDGQDTSDPNKALLCLKKRYEAGGRSVPFLYTFGTSPALTQRAALYDQVSAVT